MIIISLPPQLDKCTNFGGIFATEVRTSYFNKCGAVARVGSRGSDHWPIGPILVSGTKHHN